MTWLFHHGMPLLRALIEHIDLTVCALGLSLLIALPLGYALSRHPRLSSWVVGFFGLVYTLPSLALLALLIPWLGLGFPTALVALVIYAQCVLLRSVILAFSSIDQALLEAARGMGMSGWSLFIAIELPQALPSLLGGVRLTAVMIAGMATVSAWVNAGGLGGILFEGIYRNDTSRLVSGLVMSTALTLGLNTLLGTFEKDALAYARGEA